MLHIKFRCIIIIVKSYGHKVKLGIGILVSIRLLLVATMKFYLTKRERLKDNVITGISPLNNCEMMFLHFDFVLLVFRILKLSPLLDTNCLSVKIF